MALAYLILLRHGRPTDRFKLGAGKPTAGRDDPGEIVIPDPSVSRQHARIKIIDGGVTLRDLNSSNGTKVNGVPRKTATLQDGDLLTLGSVDLRVSFALPVIPRSDSRSAWRLPPDSNKLAGRLSAFPTKETNATSPPSTISALGSPTGLRKPRGSPTGSNFSAKVSALTLFIFIHPQAPSLTSIRRNHPNRG